MGNKKMDEVIASVFGEVVSWRRYLHSHPELSFQETQTAQFVYEKLQSFGDLVISRPTKTSVVASLKGQLPGKSIALRADMDALPILEKNDIEYVSQNPGVMHACGHDGHTAMLLGAAKVLVQFKDQLTGEIRFIFQHAEEKPPGGARELVAAGVIDGIDEIFGLHLNTNLAVGQIGLKDKEFLANTDTFDLVIQGRGGHASRPEETIDPVVIGAQVITNLQQVVSRKVSPLEAVVLSTTIFEGGTIHNIIPQSVKLGGTVRCFSTDVAHNIPQVMEKIIKGIVEAHGATVTFHYNHGYSVLVNNPEVTKKVKLLSCDLFGEENVVEIPRRLAGEDFSEYLKLVPGCFVFIGAANEETGIIYSTHNPQFNIDENALRNGLKLYIHAALNLTISEGAR